MTSTPKWNWQQKDWPKFTYDPEQISSLEQDFLKRAGESFGISKHFSDSEKSTITIQLIENEAYKTSEIEGEILNRESLQSSIQRQFGLKTSTSSRHPAEEGIAEMMIDLFHHYDRSLTHEILWAWHNMLMKGRHDLHDVGSYRRHRDPMQIVSGAVYKPKVHFEAPPSKMVKKEMDHFIKWFNQTSPAGDKPLPPLTRSSIAHLYFESIHPFEDGNGRIGRALVEMVLAQALQRPTFIALSQVINDKRKIYYDALESQNKHNQIDPWLGYFSHVILNAQQYTIEQMEFIIKKAKFFDQFKDQLNERQVKVIQRMFDEGVQGFKGGLSAKNYMTIAQVSPSTATRDLHDLVEKKVLKQTGVLKATRYWLSF